MNTVAYILAQMGMLQPPSQRRHTFHRETASDRKRRSIGEAIRKGRQTIAAKQRFLYESAKQAKAIKLAKARARLGFKPN